MPRTPCASRPGDSGPGFTPSRRVACGTCRMHQLCLPTGLTPDEMERLDRIIGRRRTVLRGDALFRLAAPFHSLYAVRLGYFKTYQADVQGAVQITGFQMAGDLLGMDAIGAGRHQCDAVALEDSEVCEIPYASLQRLLIDMPALLRHFHRMMSGELMREQSVMQLLGNMQAPQRFAAFLVNLAARYEARGMASQQFRLRMSRAEIGNYLGLTIESISRLLPRFTREGLLRIDNRDIEILDPARLKAIAAGAPAH
jgi:CRP/FNR family transcriptional regulator